MKQDRNPIRLLAEILAIMAVAQVAVVLTLPAIATGLGANHQALLSAARLVLLAGPAVYWRCMTGPRQAQAASTSKRAASGAVNAAIAMTAAAQALGLALTGASAPRQLQRVSAAAQAYSSTV